MRQVDSEDAAFLFLDQADNPAHLGLIALYDQSNIGGHVIRFQHILTHIQNRLSSVSVFHQKIKRVPADLDYPYWIEDKAFDLEYHVRHLALPKPGDWRQFCIQIARIHSRPLDIQRPLWELYVIEGLDQVADLPSGSFALYFKVHHCAMDEATAIEFLESLHQTEANPEQHEQLTNRVTRFTPPEPTTRNMAIRMVFGNTLRSARFSLQSIKYRKVISSQLVRTALRNIRRVSSSDTGETKTRFSSSPQPARVFGGGFYPSTILDNFQRQVPGATLQHTLAVVCGEATRCYLHEKDGMAEVNLSAQVQINLRNAAAHALSGNKAALQNMELYTGVENLMERLIAIVGSNRSFSDTELEEKNNRTRSFYESIPAPLLAMLGHWSKRQVPSLGSVASCGISTLPGPRQTVYFLGARLCGLTSVSPLYQGCGLVYSAIEYDDKIAVSFTSGRHILPDPDRLSVCLDNAVQKLTGYSDGYEKQVSL